MVQYDSCVRQGLESRGAHSKARELDLLIVVFLAVPEKHRKLNKVNAATGTVRTACFFVLFFLRKPCGHPRRLLLVCDMAVANVVSCTFILAWRV